MVYRRSDVSQYRGRYYRNIGKVLNGRGRLTSKKFLLGTDKTAAEVRNRMLEQLWAEVVAEHERSVEFVQTMSSRLGDADHISGQLLARERDLSHGPIWRAESLRIAEAIRKGQSQIRVPPGEIDGCPQSYVQRIHALSQEYSGVAFVPADPEFYAEGQRLLREGAEDLVEDARELATVAAADPPSIETSGERLYRAIEDYAAYVVTQNAKEYGDREAAAARRLKDAHGDVPLDQFGVSALEQIRDYWRSRPNSRKSGKPIALTTVKNQLKTAKRFVRWLHRTEKYDWSKPVDAEDILRADVEQLRTQEERARLKDGVPVWTIDELAVLYQYATDAERVLLLLGLNCAFQHVDVAQLRHEEIESEHERPKIRRVRQKSTVLGEFVLWTETVQALDWLRHTRPQHSDYAVVTEQGTTYSRQRIANMWNRLLDRVQKQKPHFRRLSFKYLRKTAGQLVRDRSNGEITAVFLCHGQPVAGDELSDDYTNRPFDKVAETLDGVRCDLQPMFDAVPDAFQTQPLKRASRKRNARRAGAAST
jgi:hypothetical protein